MSDDDQVARGRARVDPYAVPPVTGRAAVPGALSLPEQPRGPGKTPVSPSMAFEAQAYPIFEGRAQPRAMEPPRPLPPLRAPVPAPVPLPPVTGSDGTVPVAGDEVSDPVRKKSLLRRLAAPAGAALVAAVIVGGTYLVAADRMPRIEPEVGRWGAIAGSSAAVPAPSNPFRGSAAKPAAGRPTRLVVKAIGVDTALETLKLGAKGELQPPKAFGKAGWYAAGTAPGDVGPAVIAGHVDSKSGPAVFYRLRELTSGDRIEVVRGGKTLRFTVVRTRWFPKAKFPTSDVYGPTPDRQLRLITCGGVFDRQLRSYRENLVVYAVAG